MFFVTATNYSNDLSNKKKVKQRFLHWNRNFLLSARRFSKTFQHFLPPIIESEIFIHFSKHV